MIKVILSVLIFVSSFSLSAQDSKEELLHMQNVNEELNWVPSFKKAKDLAKKKNKPILVFFTGSDWCGPCKMLQQDFFHTEEFIALADKNLILYEADFPRRTDLISQEKKMENFKLQGKYSVRGYPTIIFLNAQGNEIGRRSGYSFMRDPEPHFTLLKDIINKHTN